MRRLVVVAAAALAAGCGLEGGGDGGTGGGAGNASMGGAVTVFQGASARARKAVDAELARAVRAALNGPAVAAAQARVEGAAVRRPGERLFSAAPSGTSLGVGVLHGVGKPAWVRPGEVIVHFREALSAGEGLARVQVKGLSVRHGGFASKHLHLFHFRGADGAPLGEGQTAELQRQLASRAGVTFTELNRMRHALAVPNDKLYSAMWHLPPINLPAAWDIEKGTTAVVTVAVVDTGIVSHPDLNPRVVGGYDMVSDPANAGDGDGRDANPADMGGDLPQGASSWHGSHVAGTIGAATDNDTGIAGVNWNARIVPVRVLGKQGGSDFDIAAAMGWASGAAVPGVPNNPNPAAVVNLSLGGPSAASQTVQSVIDEAAARNVIYVVAAGNDNVDAGGFMPCNQTGVLCIGATRPSGKRASYSNYGARVDLMAPGGEVAEDSNGDGYPDGVLSASLDGSKQPAYAFENGTSMAAPHIAGIVSLMKARNAALPFAQARQILLDTASAGSKCNEGCGAGLVNVQAALLRVTGTTPTGPAKLALGTTELFFSASQTSQTLLLSNSGGQSLTATLTPGGPEAGRLTVQGGDQRVVPAGQTVTVTVSANLQGLAAGATGSAVLAVTSNGGDGSVAVKLKVAAAPTRPVAVAAVFQDNAGDWKVAAAVEAQAPGYAWSLSPGAGSYYVVGVQDANGNGDFDDADPIGLYPNTDSPKEVTLAVGANVQGLNFAVAPEKAVSGNESSLIGAPCTSDAACAPGVCGTGFPGGYCTQDCAQTACPLGSRCVVGATLAVCLADCAGPRTGRSTCRTSYVCEDDGAGGGLCIPACTSDPDCDPGTCNLSTGYCQ